MVQQLLRGPTPPQKPPDVVEIICGDGKRMCFNMDAVERVVEDTQEGHCLVKLKGEESNVSVKMTYDEFLYATKIHPRQLYAQADSGD